MADGRGQVGEMVDAASRPLLDVVNQDVNPQEVDPLAEALNLLFVSVANIVQGELQFSNNEYELLKDMNLRTATEYDNFGDFASGLCIFVERLKEKDEIFNNYLQVIDGIDNQVTDLEALVSTLDNYTSTLHAQLKVAFLEAKQTV